MIAIDEAVEDALELLPSMASFLPNWTLTVVAQDSRSGEVILRQATAESMNFGALDDNQQRLVIDLFKKMFSSDSGLDRQCAESEVTTESEMSIFFDEAVREIEEETAALAQVNAAEDMDALRILEEYNQSGIHNQGTSAWKAKDDIGQLLSISMAAKLKLESDSQDATTNIPSETIFGTSRNVQPVGLQQIAPQMAATPPLVNAKYLANEEEESSDGEHGSTILTSHRHTHLSPGTRLPTRFKEEEESSSDGELPPSPKHSSKGHEPVQRTNCSDDEAKKLGLITSSAAPPNSLSAPRFHSTTSELPAPQADCSDLVATQILKSCGLAFNTQIKLLICTACQTGLPLRCVVAHFKSPPTQRMQLDGKKWTSKLYAPNHLASASLLTPAVCGEIVQSLIDNGYIETKSDIRDAGTLQEWSDYVHVGGAIAGIRLFQQGCKCSECGYACLSKASFNNHKHKGTLQRVCLQTLSERAGFVSYFQVQPGSDPEPKHSPAENVASSETSADRFRRKMDLALGHLTVTPQEDIRKVLPVFVKTAIHSFFSKYDRTSICWPFLRDPESDAYSRLQQLIVKSFAEDVDRIRYLHPSLLLRLTNCTPDIPRRAPNRKFEALTQRGSIASYASLETKAIWSVLRGYQLKISAFKSKTTPQNPYRFTKLQEAALEDLLSHLQTPRYDPLNAYDALYRALWALYFPDHPQASMDISNSPLTVFLALECLDNSGAYRSIFLIPPTIAKIQYCMRLRATRIFHSIFGHVFGQECSAGPVRNTQDIDEMLSEPDSNLFEQCLAFCYTHLQDFNLSPFSTVRYWLHQFSVVAKATPRDTLVWWRNNTITVGDTVLEFGSYKGKLKAILLQTQELVTKDILFGLYTLDEVEECFVSKTRMLSDSELNTPGRGILLDIQDKYITNPDSNEVFGRMEQSACLGITNVQGVLSFDRQKAILWLEKIDEAMKAVMCLCHVLQGPPGRMTEQSVLPLTTSHLNSAVFFDAKERTGGFVSGYHKNSAITGDHKRILRLLPHQVFTLLFVLIRLVRPIEVAVLFDFVVKRDKQQETLNAYRERIFASNGKAWKDTRMNAELASFFVDKIGVHMGTRLFRHFAIAVQRHFPETNYGTYVTDDDGRLARVADLMAGHSRQVGQMHYARVQSAVESDVSEAEYIRIAKDWHALHEFPTSMPVV